MALDKIKGRDLTISVQRTVNGSLKWIVVGCATDVSLDLDRESDEATCTASADAKEFEPGQYSWTMSPNLNVRQATDDATANPAETDATDNVTAENFMDLALSGEIVKVGVTIGPGAKRARYSGKAFVNKASYKGQNKGIATFATGLQGTGPLTKELTTV
jgi:hypothetical protein